MEAKRGRKTFLWLGVTLAWMVVIFLFSAQNADDSSLTSGRVLAFLCGLFGYTPTGTMKETLSFLVRKAAHMTEFGLLGVLWLGTLTESFGREHKSRWALAFGVASVYAMSDEAHQLFTDGRAGQVTDWLIDSAGIAVWLLLAFAAERLTALIGANRDKETFQH